MGTLENLRTLAALVRRAEGTTPLVLRNKTERYPSPEELAECATVRCVCERRDTLISHKAVGLYATALHGVDKPGVVAALNPEPLIPGKAERHEVLATWFLATFGGPDSLTAGVLDIAGGKGDLSIALTKRGVPCTLVDPYAGVGRSPGDEHTDAANLSCHCCVGSG